MTLTGLSIMVVLGGAIGAAVYGLLLRRELTPLGFAWAILFGVLGAYGGSELFGFVSTKGPEVEGLYLVTAAIGALALSAALVLGILRREEDAREIQTIEDPKLARFLFSDPRAAVLWLGVRLYVGFEWFEAGRHKVTDDAWMDGGTALEGYWTRVTGPDGNITYGWFNDFITYMLEHEWYTWFAPVVAVGELLVGIALILGVFVGIAAFFGTLMNFNFMLAGSASTNPMLFGLGVFLVLAWKIAGWYGLDRYLLPLLGAPWKPGRAFHGGQSPQATSAA
jgi:thiosulfate dehydrogenase (quinone) large subunit